MGVTPGAEKRPVQQVVRYNSKKTSRN